MIDKIWFASGKTESGDSFSVGYWTHEPTEKEVCSAVVDALGWEIQMWDIDMEWAKDNPEDACEQALLYPRVSCLGKII